MLAAMERTFGIELEIALDEPSDLATHLTGNGFNTHVENYNHETRSHWKIVSDGSVSGRDANGNYLGGYELVSPILKGEDGLAQARRVCELLNTYMGALVVNRTCGFHVHVQIDDLTLKQFKNCAKAQLKYEWVLDQLVPLSRRYNAEPQRDNNEYCATVAGRFGDRQNLRSIEETGFSLIDSASNMDRLKRMLQSHRQTKWNLVNFSNRGTIEIRQGAGTVDPDKVCNWVLLWTSFFSGFADARLRASKLHHEKTNTNNSNGNLTFDKALRRMFKHIRTPDGEINRPLRKFFQKRQKELAALATRRDAARSY